MPRLAVGELNTACGNRFGALNLSANGRGSSKRRFDCRVDRIGLVPGGQSIQRLVAEDDGHLLRRVRMRQLQCGADIRSGWNHQSAAGYDSIVSIVHGDYGEE